MKKAQAQKNNEHLHLDKHLFSKSPKMLSVRDGFADALVELGADNTDLIVMCADLADSTKTYKFKEKYPKQFIESGIAEQNMASVAAGLALADKLPFITSLAIFSPGRNWEQIRMSICVSNLNVKIVSTHAGLSHCYDGGMAQCLEDIALMRTLPNMTVISPIDYYEAKKATLEMAKIAGPVYMRLGREATAVITTEKTQFKLGGALTLATGSDATIISTGTMGVEAMLAADKLRKEHKIEADVINCHTIKPLDEKTILTSAKKTGKVVTVEDHQIAGGLGGAVAELLAEKLPTKVVRIGVKDTYGESGHYHELKKKYGIDTDSVVKAVVGLI